MKFKIYKIKGIGHIYFSKAFYTLPCEKDTIFKLCRKLGIKNTCVIITDLSKEYLKQFQQDEGKEVKVSQNRNFGYDVYVKIKKECDIPSVINKA